MIRGSETGPSKTGMGEKIPVKNERHSMIHSISYLVGFCCSDVCSKIS